MVIPALNEEDHLESTVKEHHKIAREHFASVEIVIVNDGSTDRTGQIAESCAQEFPGVRVLHHEAPRGLGGAFRHGVECAAHDYVTFIPADGGVDAASLHTYYESAGEADVILSSIDNMHVRSWRRRTLSRAWTLLLNLISGLRLPYYNGLALYKRTDLLSLPRWSNSFGCQAEILISLITAGATRRCVPISIRSSIAELERHSKAFRLRNVLGVLATAWRLLWIARFSPPRTVLQQVAVKSDR